MDLTAHACLRFSYGSNAQVWTFRRGEEELQVPVSGRLRGNNVEVLYELVMSGSGIGLLPDWLVDADIHAGRLTVLFDPWTVNPNRATSAITALYLPSQRGSRRVSAFLDFLAQIPGPTYQAGQVSSPG